MKVPDYYLSRKFQDSAGQFPLTQRLYDRIEEVARKLPNMSLKDKQELWYHCPYWEVSKLIQESEGFLFPSK